MSLETDVQGLTQATTNLLEAVNTSKATLDQAVDDAAAQVALATTQATSAAASAATATTKASDAAGSAASALAIYGNTAAQQAAVTAAQNAASVAAGHAASASSVVQQDLSGVNAAALHRSPNAVTAMFVYDTSKDSDGGAWTEKCQHTSWYNEAINGKWLGAQVSEAAARAVSGATTGDYFQLTTDGKFYKLNNTSGTTEVFRGNKREFPKLSAIVAEASNVTIYDLTEPGRPMWMRFTNSLSSNSMLYGSGDTVGLCALNGKLITGRNWNVWGHNLAIADFAKDLIKVATRSDHTTMNPTYYVNGFTTRNTNVYVNKDTQVYLGYSQGVVNSVAMTVLPDAPVDPVTGLQVPTIAVATNGGVSVIQHDGAVRNSAIASDFQQVAFISKRLVTNSMGSSSWAPGYADFPVSSGFAITQFDPRPGFYTTDRGGIAVKAGVLAKRFTAGLGLLRQNNSATAKAIQTAITNTYNTGHMIGEIRRTYLADVDAGSVSGAELVTNGTFDTDVSGWSADASFPATSVDWVAGTMKVVSGSASYTGIKTPISTVVGKTYRIIATITGPGYITIANNANGGFAPTGHITAFVATGTTTYITAGINGAAGNIAYFDNISVKEAVSDRSYKSAFASATGAITKTPVATGSQLVAYSGFSA